MSLAQMSRGIRLFVDYLEGQEILIYYWSCDNIHRKNCIASIGICHINVMNIVNVEAEQKAYISGGNQPAK